MSNLIFDGETYHNLDNITRVNVDKNVKYVSVEYVSDITAYLSAQAAKKFLKRLAYLHSCSSNSVSDG